MQESLKQKCNQVASVFSSDEGYATTKQSVYKAVPSVTSEDHQQFQATTNMQKYVPPVASASAVAAPTVHNGNYRNFQNQQIWIPREDLTVPLTDEDEENNGADLDMLDPTAFTIKRHLIQIQEEQKQVELLKRIIEQKLKVQLPHVASVEELGMALADGVILCHLVNQIFPRAIQIIHVPSLAAPKLSLAKCRKNVENFIDACRRLGLPEVI